MAYKQITPCIGGSSFDADFGVISVNDGDVLNLAFTNSLLDGCYTVDYDAGTFNETVVTTSLVYADCATCLTPTPTPTSTPGLIIQFQDCSTGTKFRFYNGSLPTNIGDTYNITGGVNFDGCATIITNTAEGLLYDATGVVFTMTTGCGDSICPTIVEEISLFTTITSTPAQLSQCSTGQVVYFNVDADTAFVGGVYLASGHCYSFIEFSGPGGDFVDGPTYSRCIDCIPIPVTPTPYPSPTPTPTVSLTPAACSSTYCFNTNDASLSGYSGNYAYTGSYNGRSTFSGDGTSTGYIYYNNTSWCLSTSVGGSCLLQGASPCYYNCPDFSSNVFYSGPCVTPTPTPVNCYIFDFNAYFDCDWEPVPTPTPSVPCDDVNFDILSVGVTPTPSPSQDCSGRAVSFSLSGYTVQPTPTPSNTPTVTITRTVDVAGAANYVILDETFSCVSAKVLVDCSTGDEVYVTSSLTLDGTPATIGTILLVDLDDGTRRCVTYVRDDSNISSNTIVDVVLELYNDCAFCNVVPTPTPTVTSTPTQTPTITASVTPSQTPTQTSTNTNTPTPTTTTTLTATPGSTAASTPAVTSTPTRTPTPTFVLVTINWVNIEYGTNTPGQVWIDSDMYINNVIQNGGQQSSGTVYVPANSVVTFNQNCQTTSGSIGVFTLNGKNVTTNTVFYSNEITEPITIYTRIQGSSFTALAGNTYLLTAAGDLYVPPPPVYVYQSCSNIQPGKQTQIVQNIEVPSVIIGDVFKDSYGNCWTYVGPFDSNYIVPPEYYEVTNSGNIFGTPSTKYATCTDCEIVVQPAKVSASYVVNCLSTSYASIQFNNFLGGSGQYQMTKTYYTNCTNALSGTFVDVELNNTYAGIPNGIVYFAIRDKNNTSNVTCISVQINCSTGGGGCPTPDMLIMVDGGWVKANDLNIGDMVYTIHEFTNEWGNYSIKNKKIEYYPVLLTVIGNTTIKVSDSHKFLTEYGDYISINDINIGDKIQTINGLQELVSKNELGEMEVVRFEISDAHTYVVDGMISHNKLIPDIISDNNGNI